MTYLSSHTPLCALRRAEATPSGGTEDRV